MPTGNIGLTKAAFAQHDYAINFFNDDFIIGTSPSTLPVTGILLDENAWADKNICYNILYFTPDQYDTYIKSLENTVKVLYMGEDFMVISATREKIPLIFPAVHGGIISISEKPAHLASSSISYKTGSVQYRDQISDMLNEVSLDTLQAFVQHLQDFGTRNAYKAGGIEAQNWLFGKFQSYGLQVELHDFTMPGGAASDNVIATLPGTLYPEEYVVLGAHYDSYAGSNNEPGADDNATGAAGILEAARIMSQYQFDRTIIFATWSGEEYGLYGSEAWASMAADDGMNILGYFNIDMAGYLQAGDEIHTDIIAPSSANELRQFYKDVCAIYLPDFQVNDGTLSGGDSDHTSFNNNGFQGIFPFEDSQNYSPYIHTSNDLIGPSVNNFQQQATFVQAIIANVASMSDQLPTPENLVGVSGDQKVDLAWEIVTGTAYYKIYRNEEPDVYDSVVTNSYSDIYVVNGTVYSYYVTAVFEDSGEESGPSNQVTVVPMPPITFPFFDDFETGAPYWIMDSPWGLQSGTYHSSQYAMTESPDGNYISGMDVSTTLHALNLAGATSAELSFWTRYNIEDGYDYMNLMVSTDGQAWDQLDYYTGNQNSWVQKTYSLNDYIGQTNVIIRFRFTSDDYVQAQGMFIDDFEVNIAGVGISDGQPCNIKNNLFINPNPVKDHVTINYWLENSGLAKITLNDSRGIEVRTLVDSWRDSGGYQLDVELLNLSAGIYYLTLTSQGQQVNRKMVVIN